MAMKYYFAPTQFLSLLLLGCALLLPAAAEEPAAADEPAATTILILGDSITAGYGLHEEEAYPALVEAALVEQGLAVTVINGGLSGDTLSGGLGRLSWLMQREPDWVFIALGANDGLRGLPLKHSREALSALVLAVREHGAQAAILGIDLPTNYGSDYREAFVAMFASVAAEHDVPLLPFLLEGVAMDPKLNLADRIHPNAEGQAVVAATVTAFALQLLQPGNDDDGDDDDDDVSGEADE